jgi:hypothetical protein
MMLTALRRIRPSCGATYAHARTLATAAATAPHPRERGPRKEGDISSVFASLSGTEGTALPARFADVKSHIIRGNESAIQASWLRLLKALRSEIELISTSGSDIIPEIEFSEIKNFSRTQPFAFALKKRGVAILRGVVDPDVALGWKEEIRAYIRANPSTKAFPKDNPAVYELYWSPGQVKARAHPNVLEAQRFLMSFWHSKDADAAISTEYPVSYADRVRIRPPGDSGFALGPHVDGGSVERWEPEGYGLGDPYHSIFAGKFEEFDPWESSTRLRVESDLYNGAGACSMFRMFQGWLSMSETGPGEGTLFVNPLFGLATSYFLLRPFFSPRNPDPARSGYLDAENWQLDPVQTPLLQGASLGCTQELTNALHPHLELDKTMVHVPVVQPGDYVAWHCDTLHAVDKIHKGVGDSSVLYIPACPLTEANARYLVQQRNAFLAGTPGPDFPGGMGEREHVGRMGVKDIEQAGGDEALRAMGLQAWDLDAKTEREKSFLKAMNQCLELPA